MSSPFVYLTSFSGLDCRIGFSSGSFTFSLRDNLDFFVSSSVLAFSVSPLGESFSVVFDSAIFSFVAADLFKLECFLVEVDLIKAAA